MPTITDIRTDFPILQQEVHGHPLAYLDSTASSQKPRQVLEAMDEYYRTTHANVHRGVHTLSENATAAYENARLRVARFINAASPKEVIFTRNATESLNLVAYSWGRANLSPGDEVLITEMEHHSNIVPWQLVCEMTGATLRFVPITPHGELGLRGAGYSVDRTHETLRFHGHVQCAGHDQSGSRTGRASPCGRGHRRGGRSTERASSGNGCAGP